MRKRILSLLLCFVLILGLLPTAALAKGGEAAAPGGSAAVYVHGGSILRNGVPIDSGTSVPVGSTVTIQLNESAFSGKTFDCWKGADGTKISEKSFRLLVEQDSAFYPIFTDATGDFGEWTLVKAGKLCTDPSIYIRTDEASDLAEYKSETGDHAFSDEVCRPYDAEHHKYTCPKCGYEDLSAHWWDDGKITTKPTHTAEGVKTYTCRTCGDTKTEPIAKTEEHSFGEWQIVTEAKNGQPGERKRVCACGAEEQGYYIKAEWEQYYGDRYFVLDQTNTKMMDYGNTRDEWHYAFQNADGDDTYIYVEKMDTGDTGTYAFLFIDDTTQAKKPVYIARQRPDSSGLNYYGFDWAKLCYVESKEEFFERIGHMDTIFGRDTNMGRFSSSLLYLFRMWESEYNSTGGIDVIRDSENWWEDAYTRGEVSYLGFDCWTYTAKDTSNPKCFYVVKDSNTCVYFNDPVSTDTYTIKTLQPITDDENYNAMSEEEQTGYYNASWIGKKSYGPNMEFVTTTPAKLMGYRMTVNHMDPDGGLNGLYYNWPGDTSLNEIDRFRIIFANNQPLEEFDKSFTSYHFYLEPCNEQKRVFDHWEKYNFDTGEWKFYSNERKIEENYVEVTRDPETSEVTRTDHRLTDIAYFRGIYTEKTYHIKVEGGSFVYNGETVSEADVSVDTVISLLCSEPPEGKEFDYFINEAGRKFYNYSAITVTADATYTAQYRDLTVSIYANAENGAVTMDGESFYSGQFTMGESVTLATAGDEGYDIFLGWYTMNKKSDEYELYSNDNPLTFTATQYMDLTARWSDGTPEVTHAITSPNAFLRAHYEGYAVSAVRIGEYGDIYMIGNPAAGTVTGWTLTSPDDESYSKTSEYPGIYIQETEPAHITVTAAYQIPSVPSEGTENVNVSLGGISSGNVTIEAVEIKDTERDDPYVSYALQAVPGYEVQNIFDVSLKQDGVKYELGADETATITLTIGTENAQLIQDGKLVLIHLPENGESVIYGVGHQTLTVNVENGTVTFETKSCSPFLLASLPEEGGDGVTVSGQVASYNPNNPVTIRLMQGGTEEYKTTIAAETGSGQMTQSFGIASVAVGTYDLVVTKPGHLTYTIKNVEVDGADVALAPITLLAGDVNGDGKINSDDLNAIWNSTNYLKNSGDAGVEPLADVNGDGKISSDDLNIIWKPANYLKKTEECIINWK